MTCALAHWYLGVVWAAPLLETVQAEREKQFQRGRDSFREGRYQEAQEAFRRVLELDPDHEYAETYLELCRMKLYEDRAQEHQSTRAQE